MQVEPLAHAPIRDNRYSESSAGHTSGDVLHASCLGRKESLN